MTKPLDQEWQQLGQEHAHLHTLFGALECTVDRDAALTAISELEQWLTRHFDREEREGGVFASVTGDDEEVDALRREHRAIVVILSETQALLEAGQDLGSGPVREATAILGATLRAHESRERGLIERFLGQGGRSPA